MRFIMTLVPLLMLASAARAQRPDRFVGLWQGELNGQSVRLRLGLIVQADGPSGLRGTLISIDQNNATFPATLVRRGDSLDVAVASLNIKYAAALTNAADGMVGMFEPGALKQSLIMVRVPKIEVAASPVVAVPMTYPTHLASDSAIRALLVSASTSSGARRGVPGLRRARWRRRAAVHGERHARLSGGQSRLHDAFRTRLRRKA